MDRVGIDAAVLSVSSPGVYFGDDHAAATLARTVNEEAAAIVATNPGRFGFAASLPLPDIDAAIEEAHWAFRQLNADAISLHTNYGGLYVGDAHIAPVLQVLDLYKAVVLLHPTSPPCWQRVSFGRPRPLVEFLFDTTRAVFDLALSGAFSRFSSIRWVVPHAGGAISVLADRVHQYAPNFAAATDPQVDVLDELRRLYYDVAGVAAPRALPALLTLVGPEQIVYGSDYPFTPSDIVLRQAEALIQLDQDISMSKLELLRSNAERLFPRLAKAT
jgi:predicted TIM-barrel fold metal-dependent hydrolase